MEITIIPCVQNVPTLNTKVVTSKSKTTSPKFDKSYKDTRYYYHFCSKYRLEHVFLCITYHGQALRSYNATYPSQWVPVYVLWIQYLIHQNSLNLRHASVEYSFSPRYESAEVSWIWSILSLGIILVDLCSEGWKVCGRVFLHWWYISVCRLHRKLGDRSESITGSNFQFVRYSFIMVVLSKHFISSVILR